MDWTHRGIKSKTTNIKYEYKPKKFRNERLELSRASKLEASMFEAMTDNTYAYGDKRDREY